jgi:hypothetical protein
LRPIAAITSLIVALLGFVMADMLGASHPAAQVPISVDTAPPLARRLEPGKDAAAVPLDLEASR